MQLSHALFALCSIAAPTESSLPETDRFEVLDAIGAVLTDDAVDLATFVQAHVAPQLIEAHGAEVLCARLGQMRTPLVDSEVGDLMILDASRVSAVFETPGSSTRVDLLQEEDAPHRVLDLWIEYGMHLDPEVPAEKDPFPPLTWDNLEERIRLEEERGFCGALLVVRAGQTLVRRGLGFANRERKIPATPETVFATGSVPIDYTKAGLLLLMEAGQVSRSDLVSSFFDGVPADKRTMTVGHLMTGASGLPDFHDIPSDRDPDHAWIDRKEAVRRILNQPLLFPPGQGREHSHSAWGLLAVILEDVSGQSYEEFTRENLFEPLGMQSTGFNGEEVPEERLAIGYGMASDGDTNAPPFWGPTSWLVMGSGGMTSTLADMERWMRGLRAGKLLSESSLAAYWSPPGSVQKAGDMYGFEVCYTEGPDDFFILLSNANRGLELRATMRLGNDLGELMRQAVR